MWTFSYLIEALISNDFLIIASVPCIRLRVGSEAIDEHDKTCLLAPPLFQSTDLRPVLVVEFPCFELVCLYLKTSLACESIFTVFVLTGF